MRKWQAAALSVFVGYVWYASWRGSAEFRRADDQVPSADLLAAARDARQRVAARARSRFIGHAVFLPVVVLAAGYLMWMAHLDEGAPAFMLRAFPQVQGQLRGVITPEIARNWAIAAVAFTATLCFAAVGRGQSGTTLRAQVLADFVREYVDAMILLISAATAIVTTCGWLSVVDRSSVGTMFLTTLAALAIVGLGSLPNADSTAAGRLWRISELNERASSLERWKAMLKGRGVPEARQMVSAPSLVGSYVLRSGFVMVAILLVVVAVVPIIRVTNGLPVHWEAVYRGLLVLVMVPIWILFIGRGEIALWSAYQTKHRTLHFWVKPAVPLFVLGVLSGIAIIQIALRSGLLASALIGLYLIGVPALLLLLIRMSRTDQGGGVFRFARWMARPVWSRVHTSLEREANSIRSSRDDAIRQWHADNVELENPT